MTPSELLASLRTVDPHASAFYLEVPRSHIVLLQAYFELHEGLGTVRTVNKERGVVCVITTPSLAEECAAALCAMRDHVSWDISTDERDVLN